MPGVADLGIVKSGEVPQIQVKPDRARAGALRHDARRLPARLRDRASAASPVGGLLGGRAALRRGRALPAGGARGRRGAAAAAHPGQGRRAVPLDALAHVDVGYGRASITRENGRRYIGIRMNVRGRDLGGFVERGARQGGRAGAEPGRGHASSGAASSRTRSARWRASSWSCRGAGDHAAPPVQGVRLLLARAS